MAAASASKTHTICKGPKGWQDFWIVLAIFCLPWLIILAFSAGDYVDEREAEAAAEQRQLEISTLPMADGQPAGTRVILTGFIATDVAPLAYKFVAYQEEHYQAGSKYTTSAWKVGDVRKQSFSIDTPSGRVHLSDARYALSPRVGGRMLLDDWDHTEARVETPAGVWESAKRLRGLEIGRPVTAVGTMTTEGLFDADYVVAASPEELEAKLADVAHGQTSSFYFWFMMFTVVGLIATAFAVVRIRG